MFVPAGNAALYTSLWGVWRATEACVSANGEEGAKVKRACVCNQDVTRRRVITRVARITKTGILVEEN